MSASDRRFAFTVLGPGLPAAKALSRIETGQNVEGARARHEQALVPEPG